MIRRWVGRELGSRRSCGEKEKGEIGIVIAASRESDLGFDVSGMCGGVIGRGGVARASISSSFDILYKKLFKSILR